MFIAIASSMDAVRAETFDLESAQVGLVRPDGIFTYVPNNKAWVLNVGVTEDYRFKSPELRYIEIPVHLAAFMVLVMRPFERPVADILMLVANKVLRDYDVPTRRKALPIQLAVDGDFDQWAKENRVTKHSFDGYRLRSFRMKRIERLYLDQALSKLSALGNSRLMLSPRARLKVDPFIKGGVEDDQKVAIRDAFVTNTVARYSSKSGKSVPLSKPLYYLKPKQSPTSAVHVSQEGELYR